MTVEGGGGGQGGDGGGEKRRCAASADSYSWADSYRWAGFARMVMAKHTIVLIPGDGIGPEVVAAAQRVLEAAGLSVEWISLPAGATAIDQGFDNVLPDETVKAIKQHKVALKGPVTTPVGKGFKS